MGCASSRPSPSSSSSRRPHPHPSHRKNQKHRPQNPGRLSRPFEANIPLQQQQSSSSSSSSRHKHPKPQPQPQAFPYDPSRHADAFAKLTANSNVKAAAAPPPPPKQAKQAKQLKAQKPKLTVQIPRAPDRAYLPLPLPQRQTHTQTQIGKSRLSRPFDPMVPVSLAPPRRESATRQTFDASRHGDAFAALTKRSQSQVTKVNDNANANKNKNVGRKAKFTERFSAVDEGPVGGKGKGKEAFKGDTLYFSCRYA